MRKVVVIVLLTGLLIYMGGYWLVGYLQLATIKKEMRSKLAAGNSYDEAIKLVFTLHNGQPQADNLYWEDEHEFHYNGKMYDVLEKKIVDGKMYITCIDDNREQVLLNKYKELAQKQSNKTGHTPSLAQMLLSLVFVSPEVVTLPSFDISNVRPVARYHFYLDNRSSDILTPPPQV